MTRTGEAKAHWEKAEELFGNNECAGAILEYSEAIKLLPDDAESYGRRAACYMLTYQLEKAKADYDKAVSLEPNEARYYCARAELYLRLDKKKKAAADLKKAAELDPERAGAFYESFNNVMQVITRDKYEAGMASR